MREERGITLISLITYVVVLLLIISAVTLTTNFLMNNINEVEDNSKNISEINKFDLAFLKDIKQENVSIYKIGEDNKSIVLEYQNIGTDIQYIYQENKIYRVENGKEKILINDRIKEFQIYKEENDQDDQINVTIKVEGYEVNKKYKLGKY